MSLTESKEETLEENASESSSDLHPHHLNLNQFPALLQSHVYIPNKPRVEMLINQLVSGGSQKLQVISDFDRTLTKHHVNGDVNPTSFGALRLCTQLPKDYHQRSQALYNHYRPVEIKAEMSMEQKIPHMVEWYDKIQELLTGFELPRTSLDQILKEVSVELRSGTEALLSKLDACGVPVLVFSAGLGDMVAAILRHHSCLLPNVHIISNFLKYKGDTVSGFRDQVIHMFNKNEHAIVNSEYFSILRGRTNVVLLGDSEGDATMAEGVHDVSALLKIGFLCDRDEDILRSYQDIYDIVIFDDQTMDIPSQILKAIL